MGKAFGFHMQLWYAQDQVLFALLANLPPGMVIIISDFAEPQSEQQ